MKKTILLLILLLLCSITLGTVPGTATKTEPLDGNGSTVVFTFTFSYTATSEIKVDVINESTGAITRKTETADYSVSPSSSTTGGTVTFTTAPDDGYVVVISRSTSNTQQADIDAGLYISRTVLEGVADKQTRISQEQAEAISRSIRAPVSDYLPVMELPNATERANKWLAFNDDGDAIASAGTVGDSNVPISSFMETILGSASADSAITSLSGMSAVNVKSYGAVGDGTTDDSNAIQTAFDYAIPNGKPIYFPEGFYKISSAAITADYDGTDANYAIVIIGAGTRATQIYQSEPNTNLFEIGPTSGGTDRFDDWYIANMSVSTADGNAFAFVLTGLHRGMMENVMIPSAGSSSVPSGGGVHLRGCIANTFKNVNVSTNTGKNFDGRSVLGKYCWLIEDFGSYTSNANLWLGCQTEAGSYGFYAENTSGANETIIGGTTEGQTIASFYFKNQHALTIEGVGSEYYATAVYLDTCRNVNLISDYFYNKVQIINCTNVNMSECDVRSEIYIDGNSYGCTLRNIKFITGPNSPYLGLKNDSFTTSLQNLDCALVAGCTFGATLPIYKIDNGVGSFETWTDACSPQGWVKDSNILVYREGTIYRDGTYSCKIVNSGSGYEGIAFPLPTSYNQNSWITIEGSVYQTQGRLACNVYGRANTAAIYGSDTLNQWIPFSFSLIKVGTDANSSIKLLTKNVNDTFYLDDVRIYVDRNPYGNAITIIDSNKPSVYKPGGPGVFIFNPTDANGVAITNFTGYITSSEEGLYDGQKITLIAAEPNSSIVYGADTIVTYDVNDWSMDKVGSNINFTYYNGVWYETSRVSP